MIKNFGIAIAVTLSISTPVRSELLQVSDLSLHPPIKCKGAGRPAPRIKETIHAESIGIPSTDIDLNGDGWCDWIIPAPYPTNTQATEYTAKESILLGTAKGARTFGNNDKWKRNSPLPEGLISPEGVSGLAPVLVAYSKGGAAPYFLGFSSSYPEFWTDAESYPVFKWNQEFDSPQEVSKQEYVSVMKFWRKKYCEGKTYTNQDFLYPSDNHPDRPLEIFICAPWVTQAIHQAELPPSAP